MPPPKQPHSNENNANEFSTRLRAYETARDQGLVFQAIGTLGGVALRKKPKTKRAGRIFSLLLVVMTLFLLKSAIFFAAGPTKYNTTLLPYTGSSALADRAIMWVMGADPLTVRTAELIGEGRRQILGLAHRILPNY